MLRDLLPFICQRLGLSTIQLGILDSLTLRLAVGQKLRKDQVALLYADLPARDLEAVLSIFFEESAEGYLFSAEAERLHDEMVNGAASSAANDSTHKTAEAVDQEEEEKRIRRSQKASKASKARWERERERRRQQQTEQTSEDGRSSSEQSSEEHQEAHKKKLDSPEQRKDAQEESDAILQASTASSSHAPEHSEHTQAWSPKVNTSVQPGLTSTPSSSSEQESVLPRIPSEENNEVAQGKLEDNEASKLSSEKATSSENLLQGSDASSQASSRALTRAHVRASDLIYPITDPIGSDQIGNQWFEALRARGFAESQLRKARAGFEGLFRDGLSMEQLQVVVDRVIAKKPDDFAYSVRYLFTACANELAAAKAGLSAAAKAPGGLVKASPVAAPRKTEAEQVAELERFLSQGANPFCLPDQKLPALQRVLEHARDAWLMADKPVEGISPSGKPVHDLRAAQQIKYYGVEDAKARIAKRRRS